MLKDIWICNLIDNGVSEVPGLPDIADLKAVRPRNKQIPPNETFPTQSLVPEAVGAGPAKQKALLTLYSPFQDLDETYPPDTVCVHLETVSFLKTFYND